MGTISAENKISTHIYDAFDGPYFAPLNWTSTSSAAFQWIWLSSLDTRFQNQTLLLVRDGYLEQAYSYHTNQTHENAMITQRPALFIFENYNKDYNSI